MGLDGTGTLRVDWYRTIFEVIDMRSFSNLWFWIGLAVMWSTVSHFVVGVPHDLIRRAEREGGTALADAEALAQIYTRRILFIARQGGIFLVTFACFVNAGLVTLAVFYQMEFAQAVLCLFIPLQIVSLMTLRVCRIIETDGLEGLRLMSRLRRHRVLVQVIGMFSLFFTSMFGMYQNLTLGVFG
ncbi:component of SufBCD complex [Fuscovulum ytuae]|uniref:component of SufBCD complex n=1 Tax=Fuscovulum ytuae TaxID=3042299 RepID=UPI003075C6C0